MKEQFKIFIWAIVFLMILTACDNNLDATPSPTPYFPQLKEEPNGFMLALLTGELILVDGCLRLNGNDGNSHLLIWPYDYSVGIESNVIQIIDGTGQAVAQVGDKLKVGGGESSFEFAQSLVSTFPENCPGPYWIVGKDINKVDP